MTPHDFFVRWSQKFRSEDRDQFMLELAFLLTCEQGRERERYREACEQTAAEYGRQYDQAGSKVTA